MLVLRFVAVGAIFVAGCLSTPLPTQGAGAGRPADDQVPFVDMATMDPNVPTPASVLGHEVGDGAARYDKAVAYLEKLAEVSPCVTIQPYGETHEGRTLYYVTITSEANTERLAQIKADNARLADPRKLDGETDARRLVESMPAVAWLAYGIHGDELSSTDAALMVAYTLAAGTDEKTRQMRDTLVIHIDPMMNPDGRERYLSQLQQLSGKVPSIDYQSMQHHGLWSAGRTNHYMFDLNRDWLAQVQPATRARSRTIISWHPHLLIDSHEMGALDTYLFDPPREPLNNDLSDAIKLWRRRFSADQAAAFDSHGWSYYTREWYEEWYSGYTNAWASLQGTIGLLYEQAGVNGAAIKQRSGNVLTYREAVHHQFVSSIANLETLCANRHAILRDYLTDRQWAVSPDKSGTEVFLVPPMPDDARLRRFVELLESQGIEYGFATSPFGATDVTDAWGQTQATVEFPKGTLIVRAAQPHRRLLRSMLDFDPRLSDSFLLEERRDLENHRGTRLYDVSAWGLSLAYGLPAVWAAAADDVPVDAPGSPKQFGFDASGPAYAWVIDGHSSDIYPAIVRLLDWGFNVRVATKPFTAQGRDFLPGTLVVRRHENDAEALVQALDRLFRQQPLDIMSLDSALVEAGSDLGGPRFPLLTPPRVAIASQWPTSATSFGATWYLLDARLRMRVSPVNIQSLGRVDLRRYNVLIIPDVRSPGSLSGVLSDSVLAGLKRWVEAGGTLIAYGNTAAFLASSEHKLSQVRLRRDVLDKIDVYDEAIKLERAAREVTIDPARVWGDKPSVDSEAAPAHDHHSDDAEGGGRPKNGRGNDVEARKRHDQWLRLFSPDGAFARADIDAQHWLNFGLLASASDESRLAVLLSGSHALMAHYPVAVPARLADADDLRVSGLLWPEARERWGDTAYATVERVGSGQIVLFVADPFYRGGLEATGRMLLNAVLLGPGAGASQPVPW